MSDNDVKIKLSLDGADTVQKGLKGVGDEASGTDSKLGKLASGGLKGLAVGAAVLATGAVAVGAGLFKMADGAAAAGDRIDEMSQKLGFSNQAFQEWDFVLTQNGGSIDMMRAGMQQLAGTMDNARQGAGGAADSFSRVGISVDDLKSKTREEIFSMTIAGLQGIADDGERAAVAADLLGRSAKELGPLLNQTAGDTEALKQKAHELGFILSDEAVAAGDAFKDSLDSLKRTFEGVRNNIGAQLLPGLTLITDGLAGLLAGVEGSDEKIKQGAQTLVDSISTVLPQILNVLTSVLEGVAILAPGIIGSLIQGIVSNLPALIATVTTALVSLVGVLAGQLPMLIQSGVSAVLALAQGIAQALPTLIPVLVTGLLSAVQALIGAMPTLISAGLQLINGLVQGLLAALPLLIAALPMIIEGIVSYIETAVPMLLDAGIQLFTGLLDALPVAIDALVAVLPNMITAIIGAIISAIPLLVDAGIQLLTALVTALPTIITSIVAALPQIIQSIIAALVGAIPVLIDAGIQLFLALITALPQIIGSIVAAIPQIIQGIIGGVIGAIPEIIKAGIQLLISLVKNMPAIIKGIVTAIPEIITSIFNAIVESAPEMAKAGLQLIQGLWKGIQDAGAWLWNKISGFFGGIMDNIKGFFGIKSPSKLLADEVGAMLPPGIGIGVEKNEDKALDPIKKLNDKIVAEAMKLTTSLTVDSSSSIVQSLVPMQPTAQPHGPVSVEATLDPELLTGAIREGFAADRGDDSASVSLSRESINSLASAIVDSIRVQSRQGVSILG